MEQKEREEEASAAERGEKMRQCVGQVWRGVLAGGLKKAEMGLAQAQRVGSYSGEGWPANGALRSDVDTARLSELETIIYLTSSFLARRQVQVQVQVPTQSTAAINAKAGFFSRGKKQV